MPKIMSFEPFCDVYLGVNIPRYTFGIIYRLISPSGKSYIGQTKREEKRKNHYRSLNCKDQPKIYLALLKYGYDKFKFDIIDSAENQKELNDKEKFYIKFFDTVVRGYNCQLGGYSQKFTPEICKKISETKKLRTKQSNYVHNWTGKHHSEETKKKLSKFHKGKKGIPHTQEFKDKMSERLKGKGNHFFEVPFFKGRKHSNESRKKISKGRARTWKLIDPDGNIIVIKNLKQFCKERGLNNSLLVAVSRGKRKSHMGWKAIKLT